MSEFIKTLNCKICKKKGISIFSKSYTDDVLINFFRRYYGRKKLKFFKNRLKNSEFKLLKCNDCKFIWQQNSPKDKFSLDLYDKIDADVTTETEES